MLTKDYEFQRLPYEMLLYIPNPPPFTSSALLWLQVLQENKFLNYFGVFLLRSPGTACTTLQQRQGSTNHLSMSAFGFV